VTVVGSEAAATEWGTGERRTGAAASQRVASGRDLGRRRGDGAAGEWGVGGGGGREACAPALEERSGERGVGGGETTRRKTEAVGGGGPREGFRSTKLTPDFCDARCAGMCVGGLVEKTG
jgi:hypothetical protein